MADLKNEPMLDLYLFETGQLIEQLEQIILSGEKAGEYNATDIDEIFRIMHTIKGASAMMLFDNIAGLAHSLEDVFFFLREAKPEQTQCSQLSDLILQGADFMKSELEKIRAGGQADGDAAALTAAVKEFLACLKEASPAATATAAAATPAKQDQQYYIPQRKTTGSSNYFRATVFFEEDCGMENLRAYTVVQGLKDLAEDIVYHPENIMEDDTTIDSIRQDGFQLRFASDRPFGELEEYFARTILLRRYELSADDGPVPAEQGQRPRQIILDDQPVKVPPKEEAEPEDKAGRTAVRQSMISVNVAKLDTLMDLVGELVISEAMVTQNPALKGLHLDGFSKAVRQLEKITGELQDTVMSMRMLPLAATFQKMQRIVRDMCKKLGKDVELTLAGQETEVDKNIIEHISDPLMHLIRNSLDHGIEPGEERAAAGKAPAGKIALEAKNAGGEVIITIKDDGRGLNKEKILARARANGLIHKPESELTEKEIYAFICTPGFSTKDKVTEFSGRGVGMDVVVKNINSIGGLVLIDSVAGNGTAITLKIPLTLAILAGMLVRVGRGCYTIPLTAIKESFRPAAASIVVDPDGQEMIMVRGQCYPVLRIHRLFNVQGVTSLTEGIVIMVEDESRTFCLFADELLGEQQVVVKGLPPYIKNLREVEGVAGCTLLGDGSISLILDIGGLPKRKYPCG